ncbi:hypothetical protein PPTG_22024 [Phytophthora nicotianae INRA-310]|uniref:Uncharacterized protein n=1 Tax=Phytophthora nicotianae (strain INRA-310) TaxID=761204 RepID=W2QQT6_PHYN3|nr:hypothetical protein PPTG_22024 [Phytophthora nicotianae INRA-310]ETN14859.1 hypothetical protein PPTG_22024 [Phytophthora nicotianae INRA-310]
MQETVRRVEPIAAGNLASLETLVTAAQCGVKYKEYASKLRALTILDCPKKAQIGVYEKRLKPGTPPHQLTTVLPTAILKSCKTEIAIFQNGWKSDHGTPMPQHGLTVKYGTIIYEVKTLNAMRRWHEAITNFEVIEAAIKRDILGEGLMHLDEVASHLRALNVLDEKFWITSLYHTSCVEERCIDFMVSSMLARNRDVGSIFTIPANIFRLPVYSTEEISALDV